MAKRDVRRRTVERWLHRLEPYSARIRIATGLLLFMALWTAGSALQNARAQLRTYDEPSLALERFHVLKAQLPAVGSVGYISNRGTPGIDTPESRGAWKYYVLTGYALAPVLVLDNLTPEYVVGDFSAADSVPDRIAGLAVVKDFGDGVLLFRRSDP